MNRAEFLKIAGISLATSGSGIILDSYTQDDTIPTVADSRAYGERIKYTCLAENEITGSKCMPVRPIGAIARHGDLVNAVWMRDNQKDARLYIIRTAPAIENADNIHYRVRVGAPEPPAYVFMQLPANVFVYTAPGALVKKAQHILRTSGDLMRAMDKIRFATLLNLAAFDRDELPQEIFSAEELFQIALRDNDYALASNALNAYFKALTASRS